MSKQEVFDYVMNSPEDTNPSVLKSLLNDIPDHDTSNYIYNVGDVAFNLGYVTKANTDIELVCAPFFGGETATDLFGASVAGSSKNFRLMSKSGVYIYLLMRENKACSLPPFDALIAPNYAWFNTKIKISTKGHTLDVLNINSGEIHSDTTTGDLDDGEVPLGLFCTNATSDTSVFTPNFFSYMYFYSMKIFEGEELVHEFVPAYNNNQYCIYDTVTEEYKYDLKSSGANLNGYIG